LKSPDPVDFLSLSDTQKSHVLAEFSSFIWDYYAQHKRIFTWRDTSDPYKILLSELMLQQTQVERVEPKYELFLTLWPTLEDLASATLTEVLAAWKGLGYNRRALALHTIAQRSREWNYTLIADQSALMALPMVGEATSAALLSFAFHQKSIYLETNIRRVLIHHFHPHCEKVHDSILKEELEALALLQTDFKHWYYALMDWGVHLRKIVANPNRRSAHYTKQSRFEGSLREVRSNMLFLLQQKGPLTYDEIASNLQADSQKMETALGALEKEGFIISVGETTKSYLIPLAHESTNSHSN